MGFIEPYLPADAQSAPDRWEQRQALCRKHRDNPEPGDYWHDMFTPACVVLAVWGETVIHCGQVALLKSGGVYVNPKGIKSSTREEFSRWLSYDTPPHEPWAEVVPRVAARAGRIALGIEPVDPAHKLESERCRDTVGKGQAA